MKRSSGFSLIEFLVYSCAGYLLVMIVLWQLWSFHAQRVRIASHYDRLMSMVAAHDLMRHELAAAPSHKAAWLKHESKHLVWQIADGRARGYLLDGTRLIRVEGIYDAARNEWREKSSSLLLPSVTAISFLLELVDDSVQAVTIDSTMQVDSDRHTMNDWVLVRNRRLG